MFWNSLSVLFLWLNIAQQATSENEIRQVLTQGEDVKVFVDMANGIWFGGVNKNQYGSISSSRLSDRAAIE